MSASWPHEDGAHGAGKPRGEDPAETFIDLGGDSGFLAAIPDDDPPAAPHDHPASGRPPPPPLPSASTGSFQEIIPQSTVVDIPVETPDRRDRIVILGRRASGKTVYLARLYQQLYRGANGVSMQALDGPSHLRCVKSMDDLARGQWPAATGETSTIDLEIVLPAGRERLVALDYPGEVFRKAFVEDLGGPDVMALLEHVDRAAAVILLIDPATAVGGKPGDLVEDDFGMVQSLRRIRGAPRGDTVPVALVLTKIDTNEHFIRSAGGLKPFVERHYPALVRAAAGARVFGCAAVRVVIDPMGRRLPQVRIEPVGVIEPLLWCLTQMGVLRRGEHADLSRRARDREAAEAERTAADESRRERRTLALIWIMALLLLLIGGLIAWWVIQQGPPS